MKVELGDITEKPTYKKIREHVKDKFGFNVSTKNIADKTHDPKCPKEKADAIEVALRYFGVIA